jgi:hypothetical protein
MIYLYTMKATVKVKSQVLTVIEFVKWENDHTKYEGSVSLVSDKGTAYQGFVCKGSNNVIVNYCGTFSTRFHGNGTIEGLVIEPLASEAELFENAIIEKFGIRVKAAITEIGVTMDFDTVQSASTLLRAFKRHQPIVKANDYLSYTMFIPTTPRKLLQ